MISHKNTISLKKGTYLAPDVSTCNFNDLLVGVTKYQTPTETGVWHSHENPMISFVLYGSNKENREGLTFERTPGSINFYHSNELHQNIYNKFPSKHISLEIDSAFLNKYEYTESQIEMAVANNEYSIFTFTKLLSEAFLNDSQSSSSVEMVVLSFIENAINPKEQKIPEWMNLVRDILKDRWNENISLHQLSESADVHPTTISKHFRNYFQCTLGEYSRKIKVARSIEIINSSKTSFTEVAYQCGFSDQSHFTRVFKSCTGLLPKQFVKL
ncbi:MAG: AraC family transcriptional regulator [Balneola sp.]